MDKGPIEPEITPVTLSFSEDIQPIFNSNCTVCHDTEHAEYNGYLDLSEANSYMQLVEVVSSAYAPNLRVKISDSEASVLWQKINHSDLYGPNMPLGGELSTSDQERIKVWIDEGALDN